MNSNRRRGDRSLISGTLFACTAFFGLGLFMLGLDVLRDCAQMLILGGGFMGDALVLVEDGVGERNTLPSKLHTTIRNLEAVDIFAGHVARNLVLRG